MQLCAQPDLVLPGTSTQALPHYDLHLSGSQPPADTLAFVLPCLFFVQMLGCRLLLEYSELCHIGSALQQRYGATADWSPSVLTGSRQQVHVDALATKRGFGPVARSRICSCDRMC